MSETGKASQASDFSLASGSDLRQLVSFKLDDEEFAVDILKVQEINRLMEVTQVPKSPDFVEGIVNLRGKVIPVISLRKRFGLGDLENTDDFRIIVVDLEGRIVGFTVDSVNEVLRISSDTVQPPPDLVTGVDKEYITGVAKLEDRLLIFLDLDRVLTEKEMEALDEST